MRNRNNYSYGALNVVERALKELHPYLATVLMGLSYMSTITKLHWFEQVKETRATLHFISGDYRSSIWRRFAGGFSPELSEEISSLASVFMSAHPNRNDLNAGLGLIDSMATIRNTEMHVVLPAQVHPVADGQIRGTILRLERLRLASQAQMGELGSVLPRSELIR